MIQFAINDEQEIKLQEWRKNHDCAIRKPDGTRIASTFGEAEIFRFIPTSVGTVITTVQCACGADLDLTDLEFF